MGESIDWIVIDCIRTALLRRLYDVIFFNKICRKQTKTYCTFYSFTQLLTQSVCLVECVTDMKNLAAPAALVISGTLAALNVSKINTFGLNWSVIMKKKSKLFTYGHSLASAVVVLVADVVAVVIAEKAIVVPMLLIANSVVNDVESDVPCVVVLKIDSVLCPASPSVTHRATMAPTNITANIARKKT